MACIVLWAANIMDEQDTRDVRVSNPRNLPSGGQAIFDKHGCREKEEWTERWRESPKVFQLALDPAKASSSISTTRLQSNLTR